MCKPMQELIDLGAKYRTRNGGLVKVTKISGKGQRDASDWGTATVLEEGKDSIHQVGEQFTVSAYGGYYETSDEDETGYDFMERVEDEDIIKKLTDERDFALADAARLQKQVENETAAKSALNEQLVASTQRYYALEEKYRKAEEEMDRLTTQIAVQFNKLRENDEREKLLTAQRQQMQTEIDAFQGILDKLQGMHGGTEAELARERQHVNALMKLLDLATGAADKFIGRMAPPPQKSEE